MLDSFFVFLIALCATVSVVLFLVDLFRAAWARTQTTSGVALALGMIALLVWLVLYPLFNTYG